MKRNINVATLFTGIGAFEQSLLKNNIQHKIILASDIDKYAKESYYANYDTSNLD